ncbi:TonB-dependent receptor [Shewanella sp. OPT22]|nr:TonB-dependent receptor [Shewanella sp. OPT22]
MSPFKPSMLTLALATAGLTSPAFAADEETKAAADNVEVIQISGIRSSLLTSQATKKDSSSVVEAISAEEIGKLPDVSIAESLARLPGLATQRLDGRANVVSIRGLSPEFTAATLNGREQVTISDNRGIEFDQYPSELLNSVVVYKTPDASVLAQAIGGTIDLQTISPLAHGERTLAINARGENNSLGKLNSDSKDSGYRASISYIDQFADDTFGIALGYARLSSPNQEERWNAWGYPNFDDDTLVLGGAKPYVRSSLLERDGFMGVFEYQPNEQFTSSLDVFYSKFNDTQTLRGTEIPGQWGNGSANEGTVVNERVDGLATDVTFKNAKILVRNDVNERDADTVSLGWKNEYVINDNWTVLADLSYSKAERTDFGLETYAGTSRGNGCTPGGCEDLRVTMNGTTGATFHPTIDYSNPNLVKLGGPFNWGNGVATPSDAQDGFLNTLEIEDELKSLRLTAERVFDDGAISSIEFGVNYSDREKSKEDEGVYLTLKDYPSTTAVPQEFLHSPTSLGFIGMGNILSYDAMGLYRSGLYNEASQGATETGRAENTWDVREKVSTGYVKANIETEVLDRSLTGNVGVQVVRTTQSSNGLEAQIIDGKTALRPTYDEYSFTEVLPSLNLNWEVAEDNLLRFATARTLARPRMDQMNASSSVTFDQSKVDSTDVNNSPWGGNSGNVKLKPWLAWQYDVSYEYYLDEGYFAAAFYYKDLENYIYKEGTLTDFSGTPYTGDTAPAIEQGFLSQWQNGEGGYIKGIELSTNLTGSLIHDSLHAFGLNASYSYNDSRVVEKKDSEPTDLPGLSKRVGNVTFYYEDYGFQARISARYRSEFLGEVSGLSLVRTQRFVDEETVVDAQIGYDFSQSDIKSLEGLSVLFQVTNLTDEPFTTYENGDKRQVKDYQIYGRNYLLGFSYKL